MTNGKKTAANDPDCKSAPQFASGDTIRSRRHKKEELATEIARELHDLRTLADEVLQKLQMKIAADISDLIRSFEGDRVSGEKAPLPPADAELLLLARIRALKLKPKKGRIKDVARILRLLADIRSDLDDLPSR